MKTHLGRVVGTIVVLVLALTLLNHLAPNAPGFLKVALSFTIGLSFWGAKLGRAGKIVGIIAALISLVIFLGSWNFTEHFTRSKTHDLQSAMAGESETVDPESELPKPGELDTGFMIKFQRNPEGKLEPVPITRTRNEYFGNPLRNPGTSEYWEELNEYYKQEASRKREEERKKTSSSSDDPQSKTITVTLAPGQPQKVCWGELISGTRSYDSWTNVQGGRFEVFEDNEPTPTCEDFPGNPRVCRVKEHSCLTFKLKEGEASAWFFFTSTKTG